MCSVIGLQVNATSPYLYRTSCIKQIPLLKPVLDLLKPPKSCSFSVQFIDMNKVWFMTNNLYVQLRIWIRSAWHHIRSVDCAKSECLHFPTYAMVFVYILCEVTIKYITKIKCFSWFNTVSCCGTSFFFTSRYLYTWHDITIHAISFQVKVIEIWPRLTNNTRSIYYYDTKASTHK